MMTAAKAHAITVLPLGMDERKLAVLRMAFRMHQAIHYRLSDSAGETPSLAIVDVDSPQGWQVWAQLRQAHPGLPALIVSAFPQADAPAPVLPKPIRVETLFPALQQLLAAPDAGTPRPGGTRPATREEPLAQPVPQPPSAQNPEAPPPAQAVTTTDAELARKAIDNARELRPAKEWPERVDYFDPTTGLYGVLTSLYRQRRVAAVVADGQEVFRLYPNDERCVISVPADTLARLCAVPALTVKLRALQGAHEQPPADAPAAHAVLWQLALLSARGRMPNGVGADNLIRLRHWPNLTRLAPLPDAMRMAAFWTRTPASPRMALRMLGVEIGDLCNFIAACHAIGLIDTRRGATERPLSPAPSPSAPASTPQPRGLLSRLLARLRNR
ncbi:hypothetical protein [Crenobacter caeni]|uniref:Uncharacterized protein n=1 Tax=Crenobacter caeni TaxID=2705474 RepID=A0A6B2KSF6_9NEIS|nr:hypothetical protein [Crenobacter caeni]NDV13175.1 hypothetical protein [Crenobacter caeni]